MSAYVGRLASSLYAQLRLMRIMSDYREAMWGVLQQAISELDFDFQAYAGKHFDRLLTSAGDPRFDDWLQQAGGGRCPSARAASSSAGGAAGQSGRAAW